eukprot:6383992-Prymnesium_polylepis.3
MRSFLCYLPGVRWLDVPGGAPTDGGRGVPPRPVAVVDVATIVEPHPQGCHVSGRGSVENGLG